MKWGIEKTSKLLTKLGVGCNGVMVTSRNNLDFHTLMLQRKVSTGSKVFKSYRNFVVICVMITEKHKTETTRVQLTLG